MGGNVKPGGLACSGGCLSKNIVKFPSQSRDRERERGREREREREREGLGFRQAIRWAIHGQLKWTAELTAAAQEGVSSLFHSGCTVSRMVRLCHLILYPMSRYQYQLLDFGRYQKQ